MKESLALVAAVLLSPLAQSHAAVFSQLADHPVIFSAEIPRVSRAAARGGRLRSPDGISGLVRALEEKARSRRPDSIDAQGVMIFRFATASVEQTTDGSVKISIEAAFKARKLEVGGGEERDWILQPLGLDVAVVKTTLFKGEGAPLFKDLLGEERWRFSADSAGTIGEAVYGLLYIDAAYYPDCGNPAASCYKIAPHAIESDGDEYRDGLDLISRSGK